MKNLALFPGIILIILLAFTSCLSVEIVTEPKGMVVDVQGDQVLVMFKDVMKQNRYAWNWFYVPGSGLQKGDPFEFEIKIIDNSLIKNNNIPFH